MSQIVKKYVSRKKPRFFDKLIIKNVQNELLYKKYIGIIKNHEFYCKYLKIWFYEPRILGSYLQRTRNKWKKSSEEYSYLSFVSKN